jgi:hypothetical protein
MQLVSEITATQRGRRYLEEQEYGESFRAMPFRIVFGMQTPGWAIFKTFSGQPGWTKPL